MMPPGDNSDRRKRGYGSADTRERLITRPAPRTQEDLLEWYRKNRAQQGPSQQDKVSWYVNSGRGSGLNTWTPQRLGTELGRRAAYGALGPGYEDPFNGANFMDLLLGGGLGGSGQGGSGGGGGGGRGGGGGSSGPSPEDLRAAYEMALGAQDMGAGAIDDSYNVRAAAINQLLQSQMGGFDAQLGNLSQAHGGRLAGFDAEAARLAQARAESQGMMDSALQELRGRAAGTRTAIGGAYTQADERLQQIAQQRAQAQAQMNAGVGQTLSAFGADPMAGAVADPGAELLAASRVANSQRLAGADQAMLDRGSAYNALGADYRFADTQNYGAASSKLGAGRLEAENAFAAQQTALANQRAQAQAQINMMMAELAAERQRAAIEAAKERAALAAQYAQMGVAV